MPKPSKSYKKKDSKNRTIIVKEKQFKLDKITGKWKLKEPGAHQKIYYKQKFNKETHEYEYALTFGHGSHASQERERQRLELMEQREQGNGLAVRDRTPSITYNNNGVAREQAIYDTMGVKINKRKRKPRELTDYQKHNQDMKKSSLAMIIAAITYFVEHMINGEPNFTYEKGLEIFTKCGLQIYRTMASGQAVQQFTNSNLSSGPFTQGYARAMMELQCEYDDAWYAITEWIGDQTYDILQNPNWQMTEIVSLFKEYGRKMQDNLVSYHAAFKQVNGFFQGPQMARLVQEEKELETMLDVGEGFYQLIGGAYEAFFMDSGLKEFNVNSMEQVYLKDWSRVIDMSTDYFKINPITREDLGLNITVDSKENYVSAMNALKALSDPQRPKLLKPSNSNNIEISEIKEVTQ